MTPPLLTEQGVDDMILTGRIIADEVYGEFLKNWFGDRGVPGSPIDMSQPPPSLPDMQPQQAGPQ